MPPISWQQKLLDELKTLLRLNPTTRPWHLPFVAGLSAALPATIGLLQGNMAHGILGCMGALVMLYLPTGSRAQRLRRLSGVALGFQLCVLLASLVSGSALASVLTLLLISATATLISRRLQMPPPGSFFFILISALFLLMPHQPEVITERMLNVGLGSAGSIVLAFIYSFFLPTTVRTDSTPTEPVRQSLAEALLIALFVAGSLWLALGLGLNNPYWVPVSCAAIIQGASLHHVWHRNVHRIVGTALGLLVAWGLFALNPADIWLPLIIFILSVLIELAVVRNYGLAMLFITPLTLLFAEISVVHSALPLPDAISGTLNSLMSARLLDITIGSLCGLAGGWLIHHPQALSQLLRLKP
ncbi:FUSC family protein [Thalassolituus sp. LLYu03]|uniref:FUSC family protein n=1 Tax=Thalassolituus sp. LLYu03 TaxID=3421656 RepID=UPI003D28446E